MKVHVVPGGDRRTVERGRLVVPAAQGGLNFFIDTVADRLHNFGFDDIALGVDCDFNDDVTLQVSRKLGSRYRRIWIYDWVGDVDFVAGDRSVNHGTQRRSGVCIMVARFRVGCCGGNYDDPLRFWRWRLGLRAWAWLDHSRRE
jgi:hypothetical protein